MEGGGEAATNMIIVKIVITNLCLFVLFWFSNLSQLFYVFGIVHGKHF